MLTFARVLRDWVRAEAGQDVFEYVLIIGIITVAVLVAVATPLGGSLIEAVIEGTCKAIGAASDAANGDTAGPMITVAECNALIADPVP